MFNANRLQGKLALITGATSGIGKSCAEKLAQMGVNLILTGRREELLGEIKNELESRYKVKVLPLKLDARNYDDVAAKIASLEGEWKNIDILINNAGLALGLEKVYSNSAEDIDAVIDTNVKGMLYMIREVVPGMVERDVPALVVNIGSVAGDAAYAGGAVYCASKAAVKSLSDGSRNRIQKAADAGLIMANGKPVKSSYKVKPCDVLTVMMDRPRYENDIIPEDIPLDVVYEDDDLLVINKPQKLYDLYASGCETPGTAGSSEDCLVYE